jgi:hypothetical protein
MHGGVSADGLHGCERLMMPSERSGSRRVPSPSKVKSSSVQRQQWCRPSIAPHIRFPHRERDAHSPGRSRHVPAVIPMGRLPAAVGQLMTQRTPKVWDIGPAKDLPHTPATSFTWADAEPLKAGVTPPKAWPADDRYPTHDRLHSRLMLQVQPRRLPIRKT